MSDAVGTERISRIVGYKIGSGNFATSSPNLPQRIAVFAEANDANQATLDTDGKEITSAAQAGRLYGFGSPLYHIMRILRPLSGGGVGGIPVIVYPQEAAVGATAKQLSITVSGTATKSGTHTLIIAGRGQIDGQFYSITILEGDTPADIHPKISDAINAVLGCPLTATADDYEALATSKWKGATADDITITIETGEEDLGLAYVVNSEASGAGTPSIAAALAQFENDWVTIVLNGYGTNTAIMTALENYNGIPDQDNPTGRYAGIVMKPFIAPTGSTAEDPSSITDTREDQVTIAIAPAPLSAGFQFEAAANMTALFAVVEQNSPHLDVAGKKYPDMPAPISIGLMSSYDERDRIVKKGCSTVDLVAGTYRVQDFVTTYHPEGEIIPQFRYARNLMIDFNVRYTYYLLELDNVVDHVIANDNDVVTASNVVKPKTWKSTLYSMYDDLVKRGLIVDAQFSKTGTNVSIGTTNPDRFETDFPYKRSGFARVIPTTATAGFNFGQV